MNDKELELLYKAKRGSGWKKIHAKRRKQLVLMRMRRIKEHLLSNAKKEIELLQQTSCTLNHLRKLELEFYSNKFEVKSIRKFHNYFFKKKVKSH